MADQGLKIVEKGGTFFLAGVLNEYADFSALENKPAPLKLNMREVRRLNSIGIRNLLKFLTNRGPLPFEYHQAPCEFIDQINMIPALLGPKACGVIKTLFVPYECAACDCDHEVLCTIDEFPGVAAGGAPPLRKCPKCSANMRMLTDSYFAFLTG